MAFVLFLIFSLYIGYSAAQTDCIGYSVPRGILIMAPTWVNSKVSVTQPIVSLDPPRNFFYRGGEFIVLMDSNPDAIEVWTAKGGQNNFEYDSFQKSSTLTSNEPLWTFDYTPSGSYMKLTDTSIADSVSGSVVGASFLGATAKYFKVNPLDSNPYWIDGSKIYKWLNSAKVEVVDTDPNGNTKLNDAFDFDASGNLLVLANQGPYSRVTVWNYQLDSTQTPTVLINQILKKNNKPAVDIITDTSGKIYVSVGDYINVYSSSGALLEERYITVDVFQLSRAPCFSPTVVDTNPKTVTTMLGTQTVSVTVAPTTGAATTGPGTTGAATTGGVTTKPPLETTDTFQGKTYTQTKTVSTKDPNNTGKTIKIDVVVVEKQVACSGCRCTPDGHCNQDLSCVENVCQPCQWGTQGCPCGSSNFCAPGSSCLSESLCVSDTSSASLITFHFSVFVLVLLIGKYF